MPVTWYYKSAGKEIGPISAPGLRRLADGGLIEPTTPVRSNGTAEWFNAGQVAGLFADPEDTRGDWRQPAAVQGPHFPASVEAAPSELDSPAPPQSTQGQRSSRAHWARWTAIAMLPLVVIVVALLVLRRQSAEPSSVPAIAAATSAQQLPSAPAESTASPAATDKRSDGPKAEPVKRGPPPVPTVGRKAASEPGSARAADPASNTPPMPAVDSGKPKQPVVPRDQAAPRPLSAGETPRSAIPTQPAGNDAPANPAGLPPGQAPATPSAPRAPAEQKAAPTIRDVRLSRLEKIFYDVKPALEQLDKTEKERDKLQDEMNERTGRKPGLQAKLVQVEQIANNLEANKRQLQFARNGVNQKQTIVALNVRIQACMQQANGLRQQIQLNEQGINALTPRLNAAQARVDELSDPLPPERKEEWCWLCDPFGKYGEASHTESARLFTRWIGDTPGFAPAYLARAFARLHTQQYAEALSDLEQTRKIDETLSPLILACRCLVLARNGKQREALDEYRNVAKLKRKIVIVELVIGHALLACDRPREAYYRHFKPALKAKAGIPIVYEQIAMFLATHDGIEPDGARLAVEHAQKACELTERQDWTCLDTLAVALAAAEDYKTAVGYAKQALQRAPTACRQDVEARLALFQKGKRYLPGGRPSP